MLVGYARVSTMDQNPALQMDALREAGCKRIFTETASGSHRNRPQLEAALDYLREGDALVVWKLSRLARSLTQVLKTASDIHDRGIGLKSPHPEHRHDHTGRAAVLSHDGSVR